MPNIDVRKKLEVSMTNNVFKEAEGFIRKSIKSLTDDIDSNRRTINKLADNTRAMKKVRAEYIGVLRKLLKETEGSK